MEPTNQGEDGMFKPRPINGFTVEEILDLRSIINGTWDSIAGDLFRGDDGEPNYHLTYDREEVVQTVFESGNWQDSFVENKETLVQKLKDLGWMSVDFQEVIAVAMPNETYGY